MAQKAIVDKLLTEVSSAYVPEGYISESIFPSIDVVQNSGKLAKYSNSHLRILNTIMGGRGEARRVETITRSQDTYYLEKHGLEGVVTPEDYDNVEKPYDAEKDEMMGLTTALWLGKEKSVADTLGDTAILTQNTTLAGVTQFSDYTNSDPLAVAKTAVAAVKNSCGVRPNTVIMGWQVLNVLKYHPGILEALGFKDNRAGLLSREDIARALDVQRIMIGEAMYNSANEGAADALTDIWGKNMVFAVLPDKAAPYQKSLGYYIRKKGVGSRKVYKSDIENPPESTRLVVVDYYDYLLADVNAGYLVKNAVA